MKPLYLILTLLTIQTTLPSQTAEEILNLTQLAYRKLENYVDQGSFVTEYYNNSPFKDSLYYSLAMDKNQTISHLLKRYNNHEITGARYTKSAKDTLGVYTRLGTDDPSFKCPLKEAAARLGGAGGQMLFLLGSLMYADFMTGTPGDSSSLLYYDKAKRLGDTTIHSIKCFVIKTTKTFYLSQELADKVNFQTDSAQALLDLPPEQRGALRTTPGPKKTENIYYIRISDFKIVRKEEFKFMDNTNMLTSKSSLQLHPRFNVKEFGKYL